MLQIESQTLGKESENGFGETNRPRSRQGHQIRARAFTSTPPTARTMESVGIHSRWSPRDCDVAQRSPEGLGIEEEKPWIRSFTQAASSSMGLSLPSMSSKASSNAASYIPSQATRDQARARWRCCWRTWWDRHAQGG